MCRDQVTSVSCRVGWKEGGGLEDRRAVHGEQDAFSKVRAPV